MYNKIDKFLKENSQILISQLKSDSNTNLIKNGNHYFINTLIFNLLTWTK